MRIGIVTPAFNVAPFIGAAIGSVLRQTHTDWRMVVVDDGSTDRTAAVVRCFHDPRLSLIRQPNAGVSAARNRGAAALTCDAILFLDGDDWLAPFALEVLARGLVDDAVAVAVAGAWQKGAMVHPPASGDLLPRLLVRNQFVNGGHVLIRRSAAGLFRCDLRFGEDWEYWTRLPGRFAAADDPRPVLVVRERPGSAYLRMATDPESFAPCLDAIHANPTVIARFPAATRALLRRRAEAEMHWVIGRELIRHRRTAEGLSWLRGSVIAAPSARRVALLALAHGVPLLPGAWRGAMRPYALDGAALLPHSS